MEEQVKESSILIREVETKNIMTKSTLPVGGYSVNPYVGCTHGCKYCYASFMKRFTGHTEQWGTFLDVKRWPTIKNPWKYRGQRVVIGSVTDGYNPQEEQFGNTRRILEQLKGSGAEILILEGTTETYPYFTNRMPSYYSGLVSHVEDQEFKELLGYPIPSALTGSSPMSSRAAVWKW